MDRGSISGTFLACAILIVVSVTIVVVLLFLGSVSNQSAITRGYYDILKFIYGPMLQLMATAFDRLPVGGWVVGIVYYTATITTQNLLMWFIGKLAVEQYGRWRREI